MTDDGLEGRVGPAGVEGVGDREAAHLGGAPAGRLREGHANVPGRQKKRKNKSYSNGMQHFTTDKKQNMHKLNID